MFVRVEPRTPAAAWFKVNDPIKDFDKIQRLVKAGFLVRTRADADTRQARKGDTTPAQTRRARQRCPVHQHRLSRARSTAFELFRAVPGGYGGSANPVSGDPAWGQIDLESGRALPHRLLDHESRRSSGRRRISHPVCVASHGRFMFEQPLFPIKTAAVSAQRPVGGNDTVARDNDRNGVSPVRRSDRSRRPGPADPPGELGVADRLSVGDCESAARPASETGCRACATAAQNRGACHQSKPLIDRVRLEAESSRCQLGSGPVAGRPLCSHI